MSGGERQKKGIFFGVFAAEFADTLTGGRRSVLCGFRYFYDSGIFSLLGSVFSRQAAGGWGAAWDENGFLLFLLHMGGKNLSVKGGPSPDGRSNLERNLSLKKKSFRFIPHPPIDFFRKMLYNKFNVKAYVKSMGGRKGGLFLERGRKRWRAACLRRRRRERAEVRDRIWCNPGMIGRRRCFIGYSRIKAET